jgi:hypothetical protein
LIPLRSPPVNPTQAEDSEAPAAVFPEPLISQKILLFSSNPENQLNELPKRIV